MKEIKVPQVDLNAPGLVETFGFENAESLMHWITTGEKTVIPKKNWNKSDNRPLYDRF